MSADDTQDSGGGGSSLPPPPPSAPGADEDAGSDTVVGSSPAVAEHPRSVPRWAVAALGLLAIGAIALFAILWSQAAGERDDLEAELQQAEERVTELEGDVGDAQADARAAEELAESRSDEVQELQAELDEAETATADFLAAAMGQGAGLSPEDSACVAGRMLETEGFTVLTQFASAGGGSPDFSDPSMVSLVMTMLDAMGECGVPLDALEGGEEYGDDPRLDALQDQCAAGDGAACDDLYWTSPLGSAYESFGATCGERFPPGETTAGDCANAI